MDEDRDRERRLLVQRGVAGGVLQDLAVLRARLAADADALRVRGIATPTRRGGRVAVARRVERDGGRFRRFARLRQGERIAVRDLVAVDRRVLAA